MITKENIKEHNSNWPQITVQTYRILRIGDSGSGKARSLFNLMNQQPNIGKICFYAKYPYEAKYQFLIYKSESTS